MKNSEKFKEVADTIMELLREAQGPSAKEKEAADKDTRTVEEVFHEALAVKSEWKRGAHYSIDGDMWQCFWEEAAHSADWEDYVSYYQAFDDGRTVGVGKMGMLATILHKIHERLVEKEA